MRKHKSYLTAITVLALTLFSLIATCAPAAPSSAPLSETPPVTESPQQDQPTEEDTTEEPSETSPTLTSIPMPSTTTKRALFVIYEQFEETEYSKPRTILEDAGVVVSIASSSLDTVKGHLGMRVKPDIVLSDVYATDYDAIVFIGGYGYDWNNREAHRIVKEAAAEGKVLAAICVAPMTLAKAGVLEDKRATTSLPGSMLEAEGAIYTGAMVERDELIITAKGPAAARSFGETIALALEE